jgi:hypothetical protein
VLKQIRERQPARALRRAQVSTREQARKPRVRGAIFRVRQNIGRAIVEHEPRTDDEPNPMLLRCYVRTHDAGQRVAIGDAEPRKTKRLSLLDHLFRV